MTPSEQVATELAREPHLWWGHHAQHGWVVLDRQDERNQGELRHLFRCRDWVPLAVSRAEFGSDQFAGFKKHLTTLPPNQTPAACEELLAFHRAFTTLPRVIRISARVLMSGADGALIDEATARLLDGVASDAGLAAGDYQLHEAGVLGGRIQLTHDPRVGHFWAAAEYVVPGPLAPAELERLKRRTSGDWSDGVGGSFFERLGQSRGLTLTVHCRREELKVEQFVGRTSIYGRWMRLASACWQGKSDEVLAALDAGEDVNTRADGLPVLQTAIVEGHPDVALLLIERGADILACDLLDDQRDALMSCVTSVRMSDAAAARIARALLERGVDCRAPRSRGGDTPLAVARRRGQSKLTQVLEEFANRVRG